MAIGLNIHPNIRVELGEFREQLIKDLKEYKVNYQIPFDKTSKQNVKETVIAIDELGIEISAENDIVVYIKSSSNEFSTLDNLEKADAIAMTKHVKKILGIVEQRMNTDDDSYKVKLERVDTKNLSMIILLESAWERARLTIFMDGSNNIYINTIRQL